MNDGKRLMEIRKAHGLTQDALAQLVGVSRPMITQIERGTKILTVPLAREIAQAMDISVIELIGA